MSQWTHIRGAIEFVASAYEKNKKGSLILPFPDQQVEVLPDGFMRSKKKIGMNAWIFSLPRAKPIFEKAVKDLPQGEIGFRFSLNQDKGDSSSSSSCFDSKSAEAAYRKKLVEFDSECEGWESDWSLAKLKYELCWVRDVDSVLFACRNDLRYCSGPELMIAIECFILTLHEKRIWVEDGVLEWEDEWDPNHIYAFRASRISYPSDFGFFVLDKETNEIVAYKKYEIEWGKYPDSEKLSSKSSENWDAMITQKAKEEE